MLYLLFLKGINVGGKHKVNMSDLKQGLLGLGMDHVLSYINSGNLIFSSEEDQEAIRLRIKGFLEEKFDFEIPFALMEGQAWLEELILLPDGWGQTGGRRDALFFTESIERHDIEDFIRQLNPSRELSMLTSRGLYLADLEQEEFLKTSYQKVLTKSPLAKVTTIRNGKTLEKMRQLLIKQIETNQKK